MYQPLVLVPTVRDLRLLFRASDDYALLAPGALEVLKCAVQKRQPLPKSILRQAQRMWGIDLSSNDAAQALLIREPACSSYDNASWELSMRCNYSCEHCYLGPKSIESIPMRERIVILETMRDLGVYRLQITGGEPLIDRHFAESYMAAYRMGMLIRLSTNASRLHQDKTLRLLTDFPPLHVAISLYGATAAAYESLTRTPAGTFKRFLRGLTAANEAGINLRLNIIVTKHNDHQVADMEALADSLGIEHFVYGRITSTYQGTGEVLSAQSPKVDLRKRRDPFTGCNAGKTFFHVDPLGRASICKFGRVPWIQLQQDSIAGMGQLAVISDKLLTRSGTCDGCTIQSSCSTCPPMVADYRSAGALEDFFCQHS